MSPSRPPPLILPATTPPSSPSAAAAFIFLHGFGDDAEGVQSIPQQFQRANKLPHVTWILPSAPENHDAGTTAWYIPTGLSPYPPSRPELEDDEDEAGILESARYIAGLIEELVAQGTPRHRIVLGGFSQGHAVALLTGLVTKSGEGLAGLAGLSGYLPLSARVAALRGEAGLAEKVEGSVTEVFLARGTADRLVPRRYHRLCCEALSGLGVDESKVMAKEYEGLGHFMGGAELRDLSEWLEKVVPEMEE